MQYLFYLARYYLVRPSFYRWLLAVLALLGIAAVLLQAPLWLLLLILLLLLLLILFRRQVYPPFFPEEEYLVQDQVIVSGPAIQVDQLIAAVNQQTDLQLSEVIDQEKRPVRLTFNQLQEYEDILNCLNSCYEFATADLVLALFRIEGNRPDVARTIRTLQQMAGTGSQIRVEPNWITGSPWDIGGSPWDIGGSPWDIGGSPWDIGGSPWDIGGSPWDIGGSPWDVGGSSASDAMTGALPEHFPAQWAFQTIERDGRAGMSGRGVRIGVFDTSPFPDERLSQSRAESIAVEELSPTQQLNLQVLHPEATANPDSAIPDDKKVDVRNHGLFVAGIINAIANDAEIRLCRVLKPDNRGDLFLLLRELFMFLVETAVAEPKHSTIINLSLGIRIPPDWVGVSLPKQVESLQLMMQLANCLGVVVVAASGNNSAKTDKPEVANLPAYWPSVIGVAASNIQNGRSCFSNQGDIAAPGGNGTANDCKPALSDCVDAACGAGLIGPVLDPVQDNNGGASNYIYWHGSSFAAPMVTGLAALVQQMGQGQLSPTQVRQIIECGAMPAAKEDPALGAGIINIRQTMARFEACAEQLGIQLNNNPDQLPEKYPKKEATSEKPDPRAT